LPTPSKSRSPSPNTTGRDVQAEFVDGADREVLVHCRGAARDRNVGVASLPRAWASAESNPSVTKWNVVPPRIGSEPAHGHHPDVRGADDGHLLDSLR
jgi:hypothetical protein